MIKHREGAVDCNFIFNLSRIVLLIFAEQWFIVNRKDLNLIKGFKAIQNYSVTRAGHKQLQKKLLYLMLDKKMGQMFSLLDMKMRQKMRSAFKQVVFQSKLSSYNTKILQE